jgi:hypothetical protein
MRHEHQLFFGFGVLFLAIVGSLSTLRNGFHRDLGRVCALSLLILVTFTISIYGLSPYFLVALLPGIDAIRAVTRVVLVMALPVSVLAAIGTDRLLTNSKNGALATVLPYAVVVLLVSLEVISFRPLMASLESWSDRQHTLRKLLPDPLPEDAILSVDPKYAEPDYLVQLDSMILAQDLGVWTLNGYSAKSPPEATRGSPCDPLTRLYDYAAYKKLPKESIAHLAARVVHIKVANCSKVTPAQASAIMVKASGHLFENGILSVDITVTNRSNYEFNASTAMGLPIRVGWRFVSASDAEQQATNSGWNARKDLAWSIPSGGSAQTSISAVLPQQEGKYVLEVSVVLEHVAWLHDLGLQKSKTAVSKEVSGSVVIDAH